MAAAWVWHLNGFDLAAYGRDFFARACSAVVELAKQTRFFRNVDAVLRLCPSWGPLSSQATFNDEKHFRHS